MIEITASSYIKIPQKDGDILKIPESYSSEEPRGINAAYRLQDWASAIVEEKDRIYVLGRHFVDYGPGRKPSVDIVGYEYIFTLSGEFIKKQAWKIPNIYLKGRHHGMLIKNPVNLLESVLLQEPNPETSYFGVNLQIINDTSHYLKQPNGQWIYLDNGDKRLKSNAEYHLAKNILSLR